MQTFDIWTIGEQYISGAAVQFSSEQKRALRAFVRRQYREVLAAGVRVKFVTYQPYRSAKHMRSEVTRTGVLYISSEGNVDKAHPLGPVENLLHRAVHDWHHCVLGAGFNAPGEITASVHMMHLARINGLPDWAVQFFFSDMVGQLGHYYATGGEYSDEQKVVFFPVELIDGLIARYERIGAAALIEELKPADQAARARHGWVTQSAH